MKVIYSDDHRLHDGAKEVVFGEMVPLFEMPRRMDMILQRLDATGFGEMRGPDGFPLDALTAVHDTDYVAFLSTAFTQWQEEVAEIDFALPYVFAMRGLRQAPADSVFAKLGYYSFDMAVPFVEGTWQAIKTSADVALTGEALVHGGEWSAFALCRPPGHHAMRDMGGGYCFVNNAAVAAQAFIGHGAGRVAILDVDYHHGNGTQFIFYDRNDVLFVSLHGHPDQEYPHFAGFTDEAGEGRGEGFNLNLPMRWGTAWDDYGQALAEGCKRIADYGPDVIVVSLGVDTFKDDPISKFKLENEDYFRIGEAIAKLGKPTLFVMEGGYAVEAIGINTVNVLIGFEQAV